MDIAAWLRGLGLAEYEPTFRQNAIDSAVLPNLTNEDLKDLGVTLVGHRRRLLDAIAALRAEPVARQRTDSAAAPERRSPAREEGQRRVEVPRSKSGPGRSAICGSASNRDPA